MNKDDIETNLLDNLPVGEYYEKSYAHSETISQVLVKRSSDLIISISIDGVIKFWKKGFRLIDYFKTFKAHSGTVLSAKIAETSNRLYTTSVVDKTTKIFDLSTFDMIDIIKHSEPVYVAMPNEKDTETINTLLIVTGVERVLVSRIFDQKGYKDTPVQGIIGVIDLISIEKHNILIVITDKGHIEYISRDTLAQAKADENKIFFNSKFETDFIKFLKQKKGKPIAVEKDEREEKFWVYTDELQIWVFNIKTGKLIVCVDTDHLSLKENYSKHFDLEKNDRERKILIEDEFRERLKAGFRQNISIDFDESGTFLIFTCILGIVYYHLANKEITTIKGKREKGERYIGLSIYQGLKKYSIKGNSGVGGMSSQTKEADPCIFAWAYKKPKFCIFSNREPSNFDKNSFQNSSRDVTEKKDASSDLLKSTKDSGKSVSNKVVLSTSLGDIYIKLFPEYAPKAVENFLTHAANGYYSNCIFHRVVIGYVQTGDPLNDGTGGESIWGREFEDEFSDQLKHDKPFTVSMANSGPHSNGSQFFITTMPSPWLDNKHTILGRVYKGADVVKEIESLRTDGFEKPFLDVRILGISSI